MATRTTALERSPLDRLPVTLVLLSTLLGAAWYRYYLRETSLQFAASFKTQNAAEVESGDVFGLSSRLSAVGASVNWTCISGRRGEHRFFHQERGPCGDGLFQQRVTVDSPNNQGLRIDFTLRLPRSLEVAGTGFLALQAALLALLFLGVRRTERLRSEGHRRLAELAAQVAHDIRSPLAALKALEGRLAGLPDEERALARGAVERIGAVASDLLERNRALAGRRAPTPTALGPLVARVVAEKRPQAPPGVCLDCEAPEPAPAALAVPEDLERALSNLVTNAFEAVGAKGRVRVRLSAADGAALLSVEDDGPGMPAEALARLGQRGATVGKAGGSGLGLSHAREAVEAWGGRLEAESSPGRGTTVRLRLVRSDAPRGAPSAVLIDDDPLVRLSWTTAAQRAGRALTVYADADAFLRGAAEVPKDTAVYIDSDLGAGRRGEEVARELHAAGFRELYLETGHDPADFAGTGFLKGVRGKEPPWAS
jgi:signal transduction histidine kinase